MSAEEEVEQQQPTSASSRGGEGAGKSPPDRQLSQSQVQSPVVSSVEHLMAFVAHTEGVLRATDEACAASGSKSTVELRERIAKLQQRLKHLTQRHKQRASVDDTNNAAASPISDETHSPSQTSSAQFPEQQPTEALAESAPTPSVEVELPSTVGAVKGPLIDLAHFAAVELLPKTKVRRHCRELINHLCLYALSVVASEVPQLVPSVDELIPSTVPQQSKQRKELLLRIEDAMDCLSTCHIGFKHNAAPALTDDVTIRFALRMSTETIKQMAKTIFVVQAKLAALETAVHLSPTAEEHNISSPRTKCYSRRQALAARIGYYECDMIDRIQLMSSKPLEYMAAIVNAPITASPATSLGVSAKTKTDTKTIMFQLFGVLSKQTLPQTNLAAAMVQQGGGMAPDEAFLMVYSIASPSIFPAIAHVSRECNDTSEAGLLCMRLVTDTITTLAAEDPFSLRHMMSLKYNKEVAAALLVCVVSVHPSVLGAGLSALQAMLSEAGTALGPEIGFVYCNCILRLLDSENTSVTNKLTIVNHLLNAVILPTEADKPPLLLKLFWLFDLDERLHHTNFIQLTVTSLARIVRCANIQTELSNEALGLTGEQVASSELPDEPTLALAALNTLAAMMETITLSLPLVANDNERTTAVAEVAATATTSSNDGPFGGRGSSSIPVSELRQRKINVQRTIDIINTSPTKGICKLFSITEEQLHQKSTSGLTGDQTLEYPLVPPVPSQEIQDLIENIVDFLLYTPSLNPMSVGEFLSDPKVLPLQVSREFFRRLDLRCKPLTSALAEMLMVVQLPKEGQKIERILEFFAHAFYEENEGIPDNRHFPFRNVDSAFVVVVATVMLNTDLHNPRISSKMTKSSFESQLRGCNDGGNFPPGFSDAIFDAISAHPLSNIKGLGAASLESQTHVSTAPPAPQGTMDLLFFSAEERKELLFGMERQRIVTETRELIMRKSKHLHKTWSSDREVAKELFACVWPSTCVVFGVAMQAASSAIPVQLRCIKGLQCCLCSAAAFGLAMEAEVSLSSLLRQGVFKQVNEASIKAVLMVAATPYGRCLPTSAWESIIKLLADIKKGTFALNSDAEMFYASVGDLDPSSSIMSTLLDAVLGAMISCRDGATLAAFLYVFRRLLVGGSGSESEEGTISLLNVFNERVFPALRKLCVDHQESDECLRLLTEAIFAVMLRVGAHLGEQAHRDLQLEEKLVEAFEAPMKLFVCCQGPHLKMHTLQGVQSVLQGLIAKAKGGARALPAECWKLLFAVLACAVKDTSATEVVSLASIVTRAFVVQLFVPPTPLTEIVASTVIHLLFIGSLIADTSNAKICIAQLVTVATAMLNDSHAASSPSKSPSSSPSSSGYQLRLVSEVIDRLILVVRCEKEPVRLAAIDALRSLSMQLQPQHLQQLAVSLSDVVLDAAMGVTPDSAEEEDPVLSSFTMFGFKDAASLCLRCSRSAFSVTLRTVLQFMVTELIASTPIAIVGDLMETLFFRCFVPLAVSPAVSPLFRSHAIRALVDTMKSSLIRYVSPSVVTSSIAAVVTSANVPSALLAHFTTTDETTDEIFLIRNEKTIAENSNNYLSALEQYRAATTKRLNKKQPLLNGSQDFRSAPDPHPPMFESDYDIADRLALQGYAVAALSTIVPSYFSETWSSLNNETTPEAGALDCEDEPAHASVVELMAQLLATARTCLVVERCARFVSSDNYSSIRMKPCGGVMPHSTLLAALRMLFSVAFWITPSHRHHLSCCAVLKMATMDVFILLSSSHQLVAAPSPLHRELSLCVGEWAEQLSAASELKQSRKEMGNSDDLSPLKSTSFSPSRRENGAEDAEDATRIYEIWGVLGSSDVFLQVVTALKLQPTEKAIVGGAALYLEHYHRIVLMQEVQSQRARHKDDTIAEC